VPREVTRLTVSAPDVAGALPHAWIVHREVSLALKRLAARLALVSARLLCGLRLLGARAAGALAGGGARGCVMHAAAHPVALVKAAPPHHGCRR
jgi:hypothetical protein